jgi:hypothetical protein
MEMYKKVDDSTVEITTTSVYIRDKKELLEERQMLVNEITRTKAEIAKIDIKLAVLE